MQHKAIFLSMIQSGDYKSAQNPLKNMSPKAICSFLIDLAIETNRVIRGYLVEVIVAPLSDGSIAIADAWVKTR